MLQTQQISHRAVCCHKLMDTATCCGVFIQKFGAIVMSNEKIRMLLGAVKNCSQRNDFIYFASHEASIRLFVAGVTTLRLATFHTTAGSESRRLQQCSLCQSEAISCARVMRPICPATSFASTILHTFVHVTRPLGKAHPSVALMPTTNPACPSEHCIYEAFETTKDGLCKSKERNICLVLYFYDIGK